MSIKQIEKLYKKMISFDDAPSPHGQINVRMRAEIFQKIMEETERLLKKIKTCDRNSSEYADLDLHIRKLLLKEVQVIIDDYVIAQRNGTLAQWHEMYGDIKHYIKSFYAFRREVNASGRSPMASNYGFYESQE